MPIYEFKCRNCGAIIEKFFTNYKNDILLICSVCKKKDFDKCVSLSSFHLKGTGWYKTDYCGEKYKSNSEINNEKNCKN